MTVAEKFAHAVGGALKAVRAGTEKLATRRMSLEQLPRLQVTSSDFRDGEALPTRGTQDGDGTPPPLSWSDPPHGTRSFLLVVEDPDAPMPEPFVHWLVYGITATTRFLDANVISFREGKNSRMKPGFTPAAPPPGHGLHHYHFQLLALDRELNLEPGAGRGEVLSAAVNHVLAWGELTGTYEER